MYHKSWPFLKVNLYGEKTNMKRNMSTQNTSPRRSPGGNANLSRHSWGGNFCCSGTPSTWHPLGPILFPYYSQCLSITNKGILGWKVTTKGDPMCLVKATGPNDLPSNALSCFFFSNVSACFCAFDQVFLRKREPRVMTPAIKGCRWRKVLGDVCFGRFQSYTLEQQ